MMLKALPLVHFWSVLLLKEQMMTSVRKTLKTLLWSELNRLISSKICLENNHKIDRFYQLLFGEVSPENSREITAKSADFSADLSLEIPRNLTFSSATYQKPCLNDSPGLSNSFYDSQTSTYGHLPTTAASLERPFFLADSPYIHSCFDLSTMAPLFCPQGGHTVFFMVLYSVWRSVLRMKKQLQGQSVGAR